MYIAEYFISFNYIFLYYISRYSKEKEEQKKKDERRLGLERDTTEEGKMVRD
jgi:hypothetical protein